MPTAREVPVAVEILPELVTFSKSQKSREPAWARGAPTLRHTTAASTGRARERSVVAGTFFISCRSFLPPRREAGLPDGRRSVGCAQAGRLAAIGTFLRTTSGHPPVPPALGIEAASAAAVSIDA